MEYSLTDTVFYDESLLQVSGNGLIVSWGMNGNCQEIRPTGRTLQIGTLNHFFGLLHQVIGVNRDASDHPQAQGRYW